MADAVEYEGGGAHRAVAEPTQVAHPWRAALRTMAQVSVALVAVAAAAPEIMAAYGDTLPPLLQERVLTVAGAVVVASGILTRVMAIPAVNAAVTALGLGPAGREPAAASGWVVDPRALVVLSEAATARMRTDPDFVAAIAAQVARDYPGAIDGVTLPADTVAHGVPDNTP